MLSQWLDPRKHPVAYLSKKLDPVTAGWPVCLWIMAVVAVLFADKLTLGQNLTVICLGERCSPASGLMADQCLHDSLLDSLLNSDRVIFTSTVTLNPATMLPNPNLNLPSHGCQQILARTSDGKMASPSVSP